MQARDFFVPDQLYQKILGTLYLIDLLCSSTMSSGKIWLSRFEVCLETF